MSILDDWGISPETLTELLGENPSLRGMLLGYVAEHKLKEMVTSFRGVSFAAKPDDHDRKKKGDLYVVYNGRAFNIESKSLQTHTIRYDEKNHKWVGKANVDASDKRIVTLPSGTELSTTLLLRSEFDILAVNCYSFEKKWRFIFARNSDLPHSSYKKYSEEARMSLIGSLIPVSMPPDPPFYEDLRQLLDEMVENGEGFDPATLGG